MERSFLYYMATIKKLTALCVAALLALSLAACGVEITSVELPSGAVLEQGETVQLEIQYLTGSEADPDDLAQAAGKLDLVWTSDDETVATVDDTGLVTAVGAGETSIRVTGEEGKLSASCPVTVVVSAREIVIPATLELVLNGQDAAPLNAAATPEDATDVTFTYTSSDETIATVDDTGLVTAVANGEADITVILTQTFPAATGETATGETARQPVTLTAVTHVVVTTAAESIQFDKTQGLLTVGSTHTIRATILPDTASDQTLTWTSSDEGVATVDGSGKVTAKSAGSAVITAACGQVSAQYELTVQNVRCSYCGATGHTSASCPVKAADQQAAAAAAAQAAAQQQAAQQQAQQEQAAQESGGESGGTVGPNLNPDDYQSSQPTVDWTQDPSNMSNGTHGQKG